MQDPPPPPGSAPLAPALRAVSVVGPSRADPSLLELAYAVGAGVAARGHVLVSGGYGGVMEAASRGAASHGGLTLGLLRERTRGRENPYVRLALPTGLGDSRNLLVALAGEAVIAVGLSAGTLTEVAFAALAERPLIALRPTAGVPHLRWTEVASAEEALAALDRVLEPAGPT